MKQLIFLYVIFFFLTGCYEGPDPTAIVEGPRPTVYVDAAHDNVYTLDSLYKGFGKAIGFDGYPSAALDVPLSPATLDTIDILVIADATDSSGQSAFTTAEITSVNNWVANGGSLWLISDAQQSLASQDLANSFGFQFFHGLVSDANGNYVGTFRTQDGTLLSSHVQTGRQDREAIDSVKTWFGTAFEAPLTATPVLGFPAGATVSWDGTTVPAAGKLQGAIMRYGQGRIAVFGEGAQFTSINFANSQVLGITAPDAPDNQQFMLNVLHWLDDGLCGE